MYEKFRDLGVQEKKKRDTSSTRFKFNADVERLKRKELSFWPIGGISSWYLSQQNYVLRLKLIILLHQLEFDSHSSYVQRSRYEISPMPLMLPPWYIYTVDATYQNT